MRHGEGGVTVLRRVEQPHVDQLGTRGTHLRRLASDDCGHVLGLLRFWTELSHCTQVDALHLGGSVQPHTEEGLVKLRLVGGDSQGNVLPCDRGAVRDAPHGVAEFLEEVRVTAGNLNCQVESTAAVVGVLGLGRLGQGGACILVI